MIIHPTESLRASAGDPSRAVARSHAPSHAPIVAAGLFAGVLDAGLDGDAPVEETAGRRHEITSPPGSPRQADAETAGCDAGADAVWPFTLDVVPAPMGTAAQQATPLAPPRWASDSHNAARPVDGRHPGLADDPAGQSVAPVILPPKAVAASGARNVPAGSGETIPIVAGTYPKLREGGSDDVAAVAQTDLQPGGPQRVHGGAIVPIGAPDAPPIALPAIGAQAGLPWPAVPAAAQDPAIGDRITLEAPRHGVPTAASVSTPPPGAAPDVPAVPSPHSKRTPGEGRLRFAALSADTVAHDWPALAASASPAQPAPLGQSWLPSMTAIGKDGDGGDGGGTGTGLFAVPGDPRAEAGGTAPVPVPPPPGAPQHAARAVLFQITAALHDNPERTIEIVLSPTELGKVRITLNPGDAAMAVGIQADRPETLHLLRRHADLLAQDFRDLGYANTAFSFGNGNADERGGFARASGRQAVMAPGPSDDAADRAAAMGPDAGRPVQPAAPQGSGRMDIRL